MIKSAQEHCPGSAVRQRSGYSAARQSGLKKMLALKGVRLRGQYHQHPTTVLEIWVAMSCFTYSVAEWLCVAAVYVKDSFRTEPKATLPRPTYSASVVAAVVAIATTPTTCCCYCY